MAFRARKVFGTFEKQTPRQNVKDRKGLESRSRNAGRELSRRQEMTKTSRRLFRPLLVTVWHE